MLKKLELRNFRKHTDLSIEFGNGLNVIRGSNEAGKSTILEAALYALYGAKALRNSLAETVTWGQKENALGVTLVIRASGIDYTFTRSKGGAECNYAAELDGYQLVPKKVTGHAEVSAFASTLLGADVKTASALMLASQSGLRGALDDGPTAVSGLMSKLADFDLIDTMLERAQARLLLGSDGPLRAKIEAAQADIEQANDNLPADDMVPTLRNRAQLAEQDLKAREAELTQRLIPAVEAAHAEYSRVLEHNRKREAIAGDIGNLQNKVTMLQGLIDRDRQVVAAAPSGESLLEVQQQITKAESYMEMFSAHRMVTALPPYPELFWEGTREAFFDALTAAESATAVAQSKFDATRRERQALDKEKMDLSQGKCRVCGSVLQSEDAIREHNAKVDEQINAKLREIEVLDKERLARAGEVANLRTVSAKANQFETAAQKLRNSPWPVAIDDTVYPPRITWTGEAPGAAPNLQALNTRLRDLQRAEREAAHSQGRISANEAELREVRKQIEGQQAVLEKLLPLDELAPGNAYTAALAAQQDWTGAIEVARVALRNAQEVLAKAERDEAAARAQLEQARKRYREYQDDLKALTFNNALVKKLKTIKPAITDMLWNKTLAAVSNFFSQMRGEQSVVSKDNDGFKVNGQSIDSLSGSTLDVLALAIRVALTKTFVPHSTFMVLDEPAYGCDKTRTGSVLGFLAAVGFDQTLLASHDELSEAVADRVILIGE